MDKERLNPVRNIKDTILKSKISNGVKDIPDLPGVYIMKDNMGRTLYIGKAASLKKRVSSYFKRDSNLSHRIRLMTEKTADISFIVTGSEAEALITESAFIKRYRPRYNIALKDDKSYPYLKLTVSEEFPRLTLTRKLRKDGSLYYGPYTDVKLLRKALGIMKRIFPLRTCRRMPKKVCLNYHIGQCSAPCVEAVDRNAYGDIVKELELFLAGRREELIDELSKKMRRVAEKRNFEEAALLRDRIVALSVVPRTIRDARRAGTTAILKEAKPYDEVTALKSLLGLKRVPRRIEAFDVSNISGKEATGSMITFIDGRPSKDDYRRFKIRGVNPVRDIKDTACKNKISNGVSGIDDYKMMKEIVRRRYERVKAERLPCPDLIIVDGGKGQLNAASSTLESLGFERLPVIGIAKKFEHIYLKKRKEPIIFSEHSSVLHLIQRLRDEAHRFAVAYHRKLRRKTLRKSALDEIEGIGKKRKAILLNKFGSVENIRKASVEELCSVKGISRKIARNIKNLV